MTEIEGELEKLYPVYDEQREAVEALAASIDDLATREAIRLYYLHGMTWNEVATHLHSTYTAIRKRVFRDVEKLEATTKEGENHVDNG